MKDENLNTRVEISDEELASITNAIKTRYGIDFTSYEKKSLKRGFARLIAKNDLGSLVGLWSKILRDREFLVSYIDDLMVNLTEMFRNVEIWVKIKNDILERFKNTYSLNVWHAGCSTGEEVYSMAIVLREQNMGFRSHLTATDLSSSALNSAQEGKYSKLLWKKYLSSYMSYFPGGKPENYFEITDTEMIVKPELKKNIKFIRHNLAQDVMNQKFEIIFCRNVMIYFDEPLKLKVLSQFHKSLSDDGFLIIGYYDMMPDSSRDLFELYDPTTRIYRKKRN